MVGLIGFRWVVWVWRCLGVCNCDILFCCLLLLCDGLGLGVVCFCFLFGCGLLVLFVDGGLVFVVLVVAVLFVWLVVLFVGWLNVGV